MLNPDIQKQQVAAPENIPGEPVFTNVYEIVKKQRMLAEVAAAEVKVDYFPVPGDNQCDFLVSLPHDCYLDGHFTFFDDEETFVYMGNWCVNAALRGNGIGKRLIASLMEEAVALGAKNLVTITVSSEGLSGVSSYFGFENLEIMGVNAARYAGMSLQQLLDLMEKNPETVYPIRIKIK